MNLQRIRAILGVKKENVPAVLMRGYALYNGLAEDPVTYPLPVPPLPAFLNLLQNAAAAQQEALLRRKGAAAERDVQRDILFTAMENQRMMVQSLADATPARAVALIENAGLLVAAVPTHTKAVLTLRLGAQSGVVACDAHIGLLMGAGAKMPRQGRFFNWEYTVDGGASFIGVLPTTRSKTTLPNLTPLTMVGVRVNLNTAEGPGPWSQVVTILVR
jgi:hypothetical protein